MARACVHPSAQLWETLPWVHVTGSSLVPPAWAVLCLIFFSDGVCHVISWMPLSHLPRIFQSFLVASSCHYRRQLHWTPVEYAFPSNPLIQIKLPFKDWYVQREKGLHSYMLGLEALPAVVSLLACHLVTGEPWAWLQVQSFMRSGLYLEQVSANTLRQNLSWYSLGCNKQHPGMIIEM